MMNTFKKGQKKKNEFQSISFVYQKYNHDEIQNNEENSSESYILQNNERLPIYKDPQANQSILTSFITKPQYQQEYVSKEISNLEWAAQQSNHQRLINDQSSNNKEPKITPHAAELIRKQKISTILLNDDNQQESRFTNNYIIKKCKVIEPSSHWLILWNFLIGCLILVYFYFVIINMYFTKEEGDLEWYWDQWNVGVYRLLHFLFALIMTFDLFIEFHVAYFEKGSYVTDKTKVYMHYLKNGFVFDFIPLLIVYLCNVSTIINQSSMLRYLFYLKFYTLAIYDLRLEDTFQLHRKSKAFYLIFKMILELLLLVQFFAAVFFRVGIYQMDKINAGDDSWQSWLQSDNLFTEIYDKPLLSQYFLSLYWSIATLTTVSYGDITPMNPNEIIVSNFAMIGAIFLFAFNVQTIYEVYQEYQQSKRRFKKHLIAINRFMRDKHISIGLQNKIRKYLDHIWEKQRAREQKLEQIIIDSLAPQLKQELLFESYGMDLIQIPWFSNNFSFDLIKQLSEDFKEVYFSNEEMIFLDKAENDDDNALYIIKEGEIELFVNNGKNSAQTVLANLRQGAVFGQYSFITGDGRTCSARSKTYTTLYKLSRTNFLNRLLKYEADYQRYCQLKEQVSLGKQLDHLNIQCFTCNLNDHTAIECPLTHYTQNSQKAVLGSIIVQQEKKQQKRQKFKRTKQKKSLKQIVKTEEYEDQDNPFVELEQYYQEKQYYNQDIDRVQSFHHYYPKYNIDYIHKNQIHQLKNFMYFTPTLKHQVEPI